MFTGIVEGMGQVVSAEDAEGGRTLVVRWPGVAEELDIGDSVAVQGACLTVTGRTTDDFSVELVRETMGRTSLGGLRPGDAVNLERAMPAAGRFDGHVVQGHVDGVGTVRRLSADGRGKWLSVQCPPEVLRYLVDKGSVTVDGVSLTVAAVDAEGFEVALIPHTAAATTLGALRPADRVNLEADILAKYVERLMESKS